MTEHGQPEARSQESGTEKESVALPVGWVRVTLREIGEIVSGGTPPTSEQTCWNGNINWITPSDLSGYKDKYISRGAKSLSKEGLRRSAAKVIPKGSVLFSSRAPIGYVVIATDDLCTNQGFKNVVPGKSVLSEFLYYFLKSAKRQAEDAASGTTFKEISLSNFAKLVVPVAPLPEQHRIVAKIEELFSSLDKGIENLKTVQQQLKVYRQAVLKWAFEDRLTNKNVVDGELPEGWKWFPVKEVARSIQYGYTASSSSDKIGPKFLRITDIQENRVNWEKVPHCAISDAAKQKYLLKDGDLVFARTGATVGKSFLIKGSIPEAIYASYLICLRFPKEVFDKYVWYYFQSPFYWNQIIDKQVGIGQPNVNGTTLGRMKIVICPLPDQHAIVSEIESRLSVADKIEETINNALKQAESLRQSILKKAFEGKLVPQDPNDEPASILLDRIRKERAKTLPSKTRKRGRK